MRVGEDEDVSLGVCLHYDANVRLPCPIRSSTRVVAGYTVTHMVRNQ